MEVLVEEARFMRLNSRHGVWCCSVACVLFSLVLKNGLMKRALSRPGWTHKFETWGVAHNIKGPLTAGKPCFTVYSVAEFVGMFADAGARLQEKITIIFFN